MNATFDTILCFTCAGPTFALRATWSSLRLCLVALRRTTKRPHNRFRESNVELNLKGPEQVRAKVTEQKILQTFSILCPSIELFFRVGLGFGRRGCEFGNGSGRRVLQLRVSPCSEGGATYLEILVISWWYPGDIPVISISVHHAKKIERLMLSHSDASHARRFGLSAYPGLFLLKVATLLGSLSRYFFQRANSIELEFHGIP